MVFSFSKIQTLESRIYWEKCTMDIIIIITTLARPLRANGWERRSRGSPLPHCRFPASSSVCTGWGKNRGGPPGWSPSPLCKNTIVKKLERGELDKSNTSLRVVCLIHSLNKHLSGRAPCQAQGAQKWTQWWPHGRNKEMTQIWGVTVNVLNRAPHASRAQRQVGA